jgi:hypothetical protein
LSRCLAVKGIQIPWLDDAVGDGIQPNRLKSPDRTFELPGRIIFSATMRFGSQRIISAARLIGR